MTSTAIDFVRRESVPHRWHVLRSLRALRAGHLFVHLCDVSFMMYLEGVPLALHYFGYLKRNGYIVPCGRNGVRASYYRLSEEGKRLHDAGERWWASLRWGQKCYVIWAG